MANLFLLLETPRAGELNHRFLCSPGAALTDRAAWAWIEAAKKRLGSVATVATGPDFVAVIQRDVPQVHGGRKGDEVLIVGGIDTARADVPAAQERLQSRLPSLKAIATAVAPSSHGLLIECPQFGAWLTEDFMQFPPARKWTSVPRTKQPQLVQRGHQLVMCLLGIACVAIGASACYLWLDRNAGSSSPDSRQETQPQQAGPVRSDDEILRDLADALYANPGRSLEDLLGNNAEVKDLLRRLTDPLALLQTKHAREADELRNELALKAKCTQEQALHRRTYLEFWRARLGKLRLAGIVISGKVSKRDLTRCPILGFLRELTKPEYSSLDKQPPAPASLPVFGPRDLETVHLLRKLLLETEAGKGFLIRLGCFNPQEAPPGLPDIVNRLHASAAAKESDDPKKVLHPSLRIEPDVNRRSKRLPEALEDDILELRLPSEDAKFISDEVAPPVRGFEFFLSKQAPIRKDPGA